MQNYLKSTFNRYITFLNSNEVDNIGIELLCSFEGAKVFLTLVLAETDYDLIPEILPEERFENGSIHVSELLEHANINEEIESILSNTNEGDTLIFFCESAEVLDNTLKSLAYHNN